MQLGKGIFDMGKASLTGSKTGSSNVVLIIQFYILIFLCKKHCYCNQKTAYKK